MNTHKKIKSSVKLAILSAIYTGLIIPVISTSQAQELNEAFDIAARSDRSDRGFGSSISSLTMTLRNAAGQETKRELEITTLEVADENVGDMTLVKFSAPRDIKGTALLSHAKILEADNQWLYLPSIKRVKRISSANKSGPFVGSEFSFEDMTGQELNKYSYTKLDAVSCGEMTCDRVKRTPLYEGSGYSKQIAWYDQGVNQIRKIEFYDRKGDLLKTLSYNDYRLYSDNIWRAHSLVMENQQTGKSTTLDFGDYQFDLALTEDAFSKGQLSRLR